MRNYEKSPVYLNVLEIKKIQNIYSIDEELITWEELFPSNDFSCLESSVTIDPVKYNSHTAVEDIFYNAWNFQEEGNILHFYFFIFYANLTKFKLLIDFKQRTENTVTCNRKQE